MKPQDCHARMLLSGIHLNRGSNGFPLKTCGNDIVVESKKVSSIFLIRDFGEYGELLRNLIIVNG